MLFKSKKKPSLAEFNEAQGDWYNAFYFRHKDEIDSWDNLITASRQASQTPDKAVRLAHLQESLSLLDGFKDWCSQFPKGDEYFTKHCADGERSLYARVTRELESFK